MGSASAAWAWRSRVKYSSRDAAALIVRPGNSQSSIAITSTERQSAPSSGCRCCSIRPGIKTLPAKRSSRLKGRSASAFLTSSSEPTARMRSPATATAVAVELAVSMVRIFRAEKIRVGESTAEGAKSTLRSPCASALPAPETRSSDAASTGNLRPIVYFVPWHTRCSVWNLKPSGNAVDCLPRQGSVSPRGSPEPRAWSRRWTPSPAWLQCGP